MVVSFGGLILLIAIPATLVGLVLIWQGLRGVPVFSEPYCKRCGYDMRGLNWGSPERICPECGSDVTQAGAIRFGKYERRPRRIAAGAAMVCLGFLLPIGLVMGVRAAFSRAGGGPSGGKTNQALISSLSATANQPWDWNELERRYKAGKLSQEEAAAAIEQLIVYLKANPSQQGMPLSWADKFFKLVISGGAISGEQLRRLCDAFYGSSIPIRMRSRMRLSSDIEFEREHRGPWELPGTQSVCALRAVEVDGQPVEAVSTQSSDQDNHYLSENRNSTLEGKILANLAPGIHKVRFEFDWGLLDENAKLDPSFGGHPGQANRWPETLVKRSLTVSLPIEVMQANVPAVTLVIDPERDPSNSIRITSIEVTRKYGKISLKPVIGAGQPSMAICCQIYTEINDRKYNLGYYMKNQQRTRCSLDRAIDSCPEDLRRLTVVLNPDAEMAERESDVNEIWGKPITIRDVPLERYDLKDEMPASDSK